MVDVDTVMLDAPDFVEEVGEDSDIEMPDAVSFFLLLTARPLSRLHDNH